MRSLDSGLVGCLRVTALALCAAALTGCSKGTYPVNGKIVFEDGQPARDLAGGLVTFSSEDLRKSAVGDIEQDGSFRLSTVKKNDGAPPGTYKVTITQPIESSSGEGRPKIKQVIDPSYEDLSASNLTAKVEAKSNDIILRVKRSKPSKKRS